jgi:hypothetical protein
MIVEEAIRITKASLEKRDIIYKIKKAEGIPLRDIIESCV